jgi:hypothetical protein
MQGSCESAHGTSAIRFGDPQENQENGLVFAASIELRFLAFDAIIANRTPLSSL